MKVNSKGNLELLNLNPQNYKLRIDREGRRMKIYIKFDKTDSEVYKNWMNNIKPPNMSEDEFAKTVFQRGIMGIHEDSQKKLQEYLDNNPEEKAKFEAAFEQAQKEANKNNPPILSAF